MRAPLLRGALALSPLLLVVPQVREFTEARMAVHMLLQFPWLMAAGAAVATRRWRALDRVDADGLLGAVSATAVLAFWMLPIAVDLALLSTPVRLAKYASLWTAGALLARSAPRWADGTLAFFAGNLAWMLATGGLLYLEAESRLCLSYLIDEQAVTGRGLLVAAAATGALAVHRLMRATTDDHPR